MYCFTVMFPVTQVQMTLHHLHQAHWHPCHTSYLSQLRGEHTTLAAHIICCSGTHNANNLH